MPTARELLEQADALMRRNRERALAARRDASVLATEDAPPASNLQPDAASMVPSVAPSVIPFAPAGNVEVDRNAATPDGLSDQMLEKIEPVAEDLSRATEAADDASASADLAVDIGELTADEPGVEPAGDEPAGVEPAGVEPDFPELTDIVTIGTPAPPAKSYDDVPEPGDTVPQEIAEAALDQAVEAQALLDMGATRYETPISLIEAAAARAEHSPPAPSEGPPEAEAVSMTQELLSPHEEPPAESAVSAARQEELPLLSPEAAPEAPDVAALDTAPAEPSAAPEAVEAPRAPEKEPWRLWSLFSFGRKPALQEASAEQIAPAAAPTSIGPANAPSTSFDSALENTASPEPVVEPSASFDLPVEPSTESGSDPTPSDVGLAPPADVPPTETAPAVVVDASLREQAEPGAAEPAGAELDDGVPDDGVPAKVEPGDDVLPAAEPAPADAHAAVEVPKHDAAQDNARWDALAEEVRMQVLQRVDLFTDTRLSAQLGVQLQPIVERASAELVATINEHVGRMIRAYIAEAIEREIESWRKNNP